MIAAAMPARLGWRGLWRERWEPDECELSDREARVLAAIRAAERRGVYETGLELARRTGLEPRQLEAVCDALLARGLIGPGAPSARSSGRLH